MGRGLTRIVVVLAGIYLVGRAVLPAAGREAVDIWRLAVGVPVMLLAAAAIGLRASRKDSARGERAGWALLAIAAAVYPAGTVLAEVGGSAQSAPPLAHAAWLSFYVCAYLGLARLAHACVQPFPSAFLLDGVAGVVTLGAAVSVAATAVGATPYRLWEVALGLGYPALDAVLLGYTVWLVAVMPKPPATLWRRAAGAWAVLLVCDVVFVGLGLAQELSPIALHTAGYPIVMVLLARAADAPLPPRTPLALDTRSALAVPAGTMLVLLATLGVAAFEPPVGPTVPLVVLALVVLTARVVLIHQFASRLAVTRRFERGFDEAGIGMGIADMNGHWVRVNDALGALLGRAAAELVGQDSLLPVEGDRGAVVRALRAQFLRAGGPAEPVHVRAAVPGDTRDLLVTGDLVDGAPGPQYFVQVRDVTVERRARRHADAVSTISRQAVALDDLGDLLAWVVPELVAATDAELVAWVPLDEADQPVSRPLADELGVDTLDDLRAGGSILLGSGSKHSVALDDPRAVELGLPSLHRRGFRYVTFTRVQPRAAGRAVLCVAHRTAPERPSDERTCLDTVANVLATAADRAHDERASRHRALHDPLTGLANRALLMAHLAPAIANARRERASVGVLVIDLDRFKLVNDTLGHEIGDGLLRGVADRLARHTRDGDLLARLGGDEFVLVVSKVTDHAAVDRAATRVVEALDTPIEVGGRELNVGASIGVAIMPGTTATPEALLHEADLAMYRAKRAGGSQWAHADQAARARVENRDEDVAADLKHAVRTGALRLALQPQVSLAERRLVGFEALVRWARPRHGIVFPDGFIPLATTLGLVEEIGEWVLGEALAFAARLPGPVAPRVTINLLPTQLGPALPELIDERCQAARVSARRLRIDVPAGTVVTDEAAMDMTARLRERGIGVVLEDFGTGWTSLSALQRHPVDELKLDRALVARLHDSAAARSVARATVRLAEELGVPVSAPGIEHPAQLAAARDLGISIAQGHLVAPPLGPEDALRYAHDGSWEPILAR